MLFKWSKNNINIFVLSVLFPHINFKVHDYTEVRRTNTHTVDPHGQTQPHQHSFSIAQASFQIFSFSPEVNSELGFVLFLFGLLYLDSGLGCVRVRARPGSGVL